MTARIITVFNQKGGSGKTTVSMQLAGSLAKRGLKVLVVDADPQGTATRWAASADDETPFPAPVAGMSVAGNKIHREVGKYVNDYSVIIIDCPPSLDSPIPQSALLIADLAIVPVIPSPADLWATRGISRFIESASTVNEALMVRILANMCQPHTSLGKDALELLDDTGFLIPLFATRWHQRVAYRESAVFGGSVLDLGQHKAKEAITEVQKLTDEVLELLKARQN